EYGSYYSAEVFPHYVIQGERHINPEERAIAAVHFRVDDASTLFYDFEAFSCLIDARPFIDQIAHANAVDRHVTTGSEPEILYFTGKRKIFAVDTAVGRVSATHNPRHIVGDPSGLHSCPKQILELSS
ncbi:MAG TPA: hypothetical protein VLN58_04555, partial [Verrucomicrobiae bacterium]|nr:hypothetical protein [Verrucomicrobiae bacterium]